MSEDPYLFILKDVQSQVTQIREGQDLLIRSAAENSTDIDILKEHRRTDSSNIKNHNDRLIKIENRIGPVAAGLVMFFGTVIAVVLNVVKDAWSGS